MCQRAEEMQDRLVDAQGGPAAGEILAHLVQVFVEAFRTHGELQQLALALEQALVAFQAEQALVVLVMVVLGPGGQFE
ncbi:hypothetical protein D3C86_1994540 [compost metagenome]